MLEDAASVHSAPDTWTVSDMKIPKVMNESDISNPFNWGSRTRTYDIAVNSRPFYQLNYTPIWWRDQGIEPCPGAYETPVLPLHPSATMD